MAKGEFSQATRKQIIERDEGRCQWCGLQIFVMVDGKPMGRLFWGEISLQHRVPRGAGGTSDPRVASPANGVLVCGTGTTGCHGDIESHRTEAAIRGFGISLNGKRELILTTELERYDGVKFLLRDDGTRTRV